MRIINADTNFDRNILYLMLIGSRSVTPCFIDDRQTDITLIYTTLLPRVAAEFQITSIMSSQRRQEEVTGFLH